jgi:hypothetical protein
MFKPLADKEEHLCGLMKEWGANKSLARPTGTFV